MTIIYEDRLVQPLKAGGLSNDKSTLEGIANFVIDNMDDDYMYIIGPGTTTQKIMDKLELSNTLLGIDIVYRKKLYASDVNERDLLIITSKHKCKIIVSPIGGQGYILGRGNQQISHQIIERVSKENIIIISTPNKILSFKGKPLLVDSGDQIIDKKLKGYYRIIVGYNEEYLYECK